MLIFLLFAGMSAGVVCAVYVVAAGYSLWMVLPAYSLGGCLGMLVSAAILCIPQRLMARWPNVAPKIVFAATVMGGMILFDAGADMQLKDVQSNVTEVVVQ